MLNYLWVNYNPTGTPCAACQIFIGQIFRPEDTIGMQPMHPHCFCDFIITDNPTDPPPLTTIDFANLTAAARDILVRRVAYLLREHQHVPTLLRPLIPEAEEYNRQHDPERNTPMINSQRTFSGTVHLTPRPPTPTDNRSEYDCVLIQPGYVIRADQTESEWLIPAAVLRDNFTLFDSVPSYLDHPELFGFGWHQTPQVKHLAGLFHNVGWSEQQQAITGTLRLYDQHPNSAGALLSALLDQILADQEAGLEVPPIGLSAVFFQTSHLDEATGKEVTDAITYVESVDVVYSPGARGYILRACNALAAHNPGQQWAGISVPSPLQGDPIMTMPIIPVPSTIPEPQAPPTPPVTLAPAVTVEDITAINTQMSEILARLDAQAEAHTVHGNGAGQTFLYSGRAGIDQVQLAVDALFSGVRPPSGVRPLSGIRELYTLLSGDFEMNGVFQEDRVYLANVTSTTMAQMVANVLNKRVMNIFATFPKWWASGVTEQDFNSLQQIRWITLGGVGELPTVAEGAAYTELTWDDLAQRSTFAKKGGYLGITMESIDKDDTAHVVAAPRALAQSAWLTLGKAIAEIFTANTNVGPNVYYDDSNQRALFHTSNSNLGTTALSNAAWNATKIAMQKQTELGSGERLAGLAYPKNLWVPIDLENTALTVLASDGLPGTGNNDINPDSAGNSHDALLANARSRIIKVPFWTSTTNWAAQADPMLWPTIGIGYRYGREPEIFSVADPRAGLMFTNDTMPVKVRFFFAVGPISYSGLYKHNI